MKSVRIYGYKVGLVFRKGNFLKVLTEGKYWVRWGDEVQIFNLNIPFTTPCELNILLEDKTVAEMLNVVIVKDNEVCLVFKEGIFQKVLTPGRYAYWKGIVKYEFPIFDLNELEVPASIDKKILTKAGVYSFIRTHIVESYETGLLFVGGEVCKRIACWNIPFLE